MVGRDKTSSASSAVVAGDTGSGLKNVVSV